MIGDLIFGIGALFLGIINSILSGFGIIFPDNVEDSIYYFLSFFSYLQGIFPVTTFMLALGVYSSFAGLLYLIKIILWLIGHIPWLGKHKNLPQL